MNGVVVDANLLCLLVVGLTDQNTISRHPRLKAYDSDDYALVMSIISKFDDMILCPHVLAEASNLLPYRQGPGTVTRLFETLATLIRACSERSVDAAIASDDPVYHRLGLTDAVLLLLASDTRNALVSDDAALCRATEVRGFRAINYNHVRDGAVKLEDLTI